MATLRCLGLILLVIAGSAAERQVGPGKTYAKPSKAAAAAGNGDTIIIAAGEYVGDVCTWHQSNLTIRGEGGRAHLKAGGQNAGGKGIWVVAGNNVTIENIEFSGAAVPSKNGAGIRAEGSGLTIRNCSFHDNQNGILSGACGSSDIVIEGCEFAANGAGDGQSHNLYIGEVRSLLFRWNYSHHAKVGHNLKSRALTSIIVANRIMDEATGTASYAIDLPNGGLAFLLGNTIQQGPKASNFSAVVSYGAEGDPHPNQRLYVVNNTFANDHAKPTTFVHVAGSAKMVTIKNNLFLGQGDISDRKPAASLRNLVADDSAVVNRAGYDYHLATESPAINAGLKPGNADGLPLLPATQYVHPLSQEVRTVNGGAVDVGAFESGTAPGEQNAAKSAKPGSGAAKTDPTP